MSQFLKDMRRLSAVPPIRRAEQVPSESHNLPLYAKELNAPLYAKNLTPSGQSGIPDAPGASKQPGHTKRPASLSGKQRPVKSAQDGHSLAEQSIYEALWRDAAQGSDPTCREIRIGYLRLMKRTPLGKNAILSNLKSLEEKLAIETIAEENSSTCTGRTYRVYDYRVILERRKQAGLTWFVRSRSGARLLPPPVPLEAPGISNAPGHSESTPPVPSNGTEPVPSKSPPLGSSLGKEKELPSSSHAISTIQVTGNVSEEFRQETGRRPEDGTSHAQLVEFLHTELGFVDDAAVAQIIRDCRQRAPDVTTEELIDMTKAAIERKSNMRRMDNPIGHLIRQIPQCFEGEAFRQYRAGKQREREAMEAETARIAAEMKEILADPERAAEHEMARQVLSTNPGLLVANLR